MNNYEYHRGRLIPVDLNGKTIESYCKALLKKYGSIYNGKNWRKDFKESLYELYYLKCNNLYKIEEDDAYRDTIIEASKEQTTGIITYFVKFYNGEMIFDDALDKVYKKVNKRR